MTDDSASYPRQPDEQDTLDDLFRAAADRLDARAARITDEQLDEQLDQLLARVEREETSPSQVPKPMPVVHDLAGLQSMSAPAPGDWLMEWERAGDVLAAAEVEAQEILATAREAAKAEIARGERVAAEAEEHARQILKVAEARHDEALEHAAQMIAEAREQAEETIAKLEAERRTLHEIREVLELQHLVAGASRGAPQGARDHAAAGSRLGRQEVARYRLPSGETIVAAGDVIVSETWLVAGTRRLPIRELRHIRLARQGPGNWLQILIIGVGCLLSLTGLATGVTALSVLLVGLATAVVLLGPTVLQRVRPGPLVLRATYRGVEVPIFSSTDDAVFHHVMGAVLRAHEAASCRDHDLPDTPSVGEEAGKPGVGFSPAFT